MGAVWHHATDLGLCVRADRRNALGSPLLALGFLARMVASQPWAPPLAAVEIVTTGSPTPLPYLHRGEHWHVTVAEAALPALELRIDE